MSRPPLPDHFRYGLSEEIEAFYRARAAEGMYPTDLAVIVLRNEAERRGEVSLLPKPERTGKVGRPRKTPLEKDQTAMKLRMAMEARETSVRSQRNASETPVHAETEIRFPPIRIVLSYEDCMARKAR